MNVIRVLIFLFVLSLIGIATYIYLGVYDVAADVPHSAFAFNVMQVARQRSIAARAEEIKVPPLDDPALIAAGGDHYRAMCSSCHLAPGITDSDLRKGLNPRPPNLTQPLTATPAEMFWAIKHGIKMSAMPAWGASHDDQAIWGIVAFVQKLPGMTPEQYEAISAAGHADNHGQPAAGQGAQGAHADTSEENAHDSAQPSAESTQAAAAGIAGGPQSAEAPLSLDGLKPGAVPEAEQVAAAFHQALKSGDRAGVLALLAPEVSVSEAGHTQTRDEYAAGPLEEDIAFLKNAQFKLVSMASMLTGDSALVGSDSEVRTDSEGQAVRRSRELLTLKRENGSWKIVAIHWQSLPVAPSDATAPSDH